MPDNDLKDVAPLKKGYSKETISDNIRIGRRLGRPEKQAVAVAFNVARKAAKKAGKRPAHLRPKR